MLLAVVDSGADCSLVPADMARGLGLPAIDEIWIEGVGAGAVRVTVHAARVEFANVSCLGRVVAFGSEAILGRDLLNRTVARLDGPRLALSFPLP